MGRALTEKSSLFNLGWSNKTHYASIGSIYANGDTMGEQILVTHRFPHPDYNNKTRENDYMLLKLVKKPRMLRWRSLEMEHTTSLRICQRQYSAGAPVKRSF